MFADFSQKSIKFQFECTFLHARIKNNFLRINKGTTENEHER